MSITRPSARLFAATLFTGLALTACAATADREDTGTDEGALSRCGTCADGLSCNRAWSAPSCVPSHAVGETCDWRGIADMCEEGADCIGYLHATCLARGQKNGRCRQHAASRCDPGLECSDSPYAMNARCLTLGKAGDACAPLEIACEEGTTCADAPASDGERSRICRVDGAMDGMCRSEGVQCDPGLRCAAPYPGYEKRCLADWHIGLPQAPYEVVTNLSWDDCTLRDGNGQQIATVSRSFGLSHDGSTISTSVPGMHTPTTQLRAAIQDNGTFWLERSITSLSGTSHEKLGGRIVGMHLTASYDYSDAYQSIRCPLREFESAAK